jgi:hypothetical protein
MSSRRFFIVIDVPEDTYPASDPFYAPDGKDPYGMSSMAMWVEAGIEDEGTCTDITVYMSLDKLLADRDEGLDMFRPESLEQVAPL